MLENINETNVTMQADKVEEVLSKEIVESNNEMTFKKDSEICSQIIKDEPDIDECSFGDDVLTKYDINLEDDIEKVEVTSHESSEETEEFGSAETPKTECEQPLFSSIPTQNPNESIKSWLQRITDMQNEIQKKYNVPSSSISSSNCQTLVNTPSFPSTTSNNAPAALPTPNRVVKYQDLPYMGEMTLDNSKPRRGRKPKKADICHLIYKNYGTIFPGTPNPGSYLEKDTHHISKKAGLLDAKDFNDGINRADVQNRIISSLLEKRLTQEYNRSKEAKKSQQKASKDRSDQHEPLNLCIRDLNHLKIRFLKKNDNTYTSEIKSEPHSDDEVELVRASPTPSISSKHEQRFPSVTPDSASTPSPDPMKTAEGTAPGGYVYWPNAGVFIHPVALQQQLMMYQRMASDNSYILPNNISPKPPPEETSSCSSKQDHVTPELRKLVPKLVKPKISSSVGNTEEAAFHRPAPHEIKKRNAPSAENSKAPTKRKRSAIFIPPIPSENNTNPATEVSICKFKFTGGAKPSLQEKKMLSVDSGGNFRYYSGTGDKSMRGYEFFPRETLQQQINSSQGSSTGAFLQASGEKIYPTPPVDFAGSKTGSEFLLSPDLPVANFPPTQTSNQELNTQRLKKRKSRKSLQREKLEQTFKEKGFLIQTQQTESAEGATYCKFRQLRKFTRYLFRSWKDYLPGNIADGEAPRLGGGENGELSLTELPRDTADNLSVNSSDISSNIQ